MAIKNEQPVTAYRPSLCIVDKMPQLVRTKLIRCSTVVTDAYPLIFGVVIPGLVVMLCFEDEERWD
jgi:hypothetical protein